MIQDRPRCPWPTPGDTLYIDYHDREWGVPVYDDRRIFEFLVLEAFQAGLSWRTILHKRENFRKAFADFQFEKVARFKPSTVERLMQNAGIIRNRAKIEATIANARLFMAVRKEFGTFSKYMWGWVGGKTVMNRVKSMKDVKPFSEEALLWAKDLKKRGFKFLGPTVVYAHMQATGMVNDHLVTCFRHQTCTRPGGMALPRRKRKRA